jgi:hypothetical protein
MKRSSFVSIVVLAVGLLVPNLCFSLDFYDDFSGPTIDKTRWRETELVREIRNFAGNNKLFFKTVNPSPVNESSFPYTQRNNLPFSDPSAINSFQAEVTVLGSNSTGSAVACVYLGGTFYNDGTSGGGNAGNIFPQIMIGRTSTGLWAQYSVLRYPTNTSAYIRLDYGNFTTPISEGIPYTLSISYDGDKQFTFKVGTETLFSDPSKLPERVGGPSQPYMGLLTAATPYASSETASISGTFDDVYVNGTPFEDFSSLTIDQTKWSTYELVNEITGGKLRSKVRTESTSQVNNPLEIAYPLGIKAVQANVTPVVFSNPQGLYADANISGIFFNDGTPGSGYIGDIYARVSIGGNGTAPVAQWGVFKILDSAFNTTQALDQGALNTPIVLGNTYTLYLEWNGTEFTFKINGEVAHSAPANYIPAITIHPVKHPLIRLRTIITPEVGKTDATIEALFDDVMVDYVVPNDDFSETYIDESKWQTGELVREIDPMSQRLIMKYASSNPAGITSFPYTTTNNLTFSDPNSVNSIEADVTLLSFDLRNNAYTRARIAGRWYNNGSGTPGTDMTGDIWAEISLREDPSGLYGYWNVSRYTNADGSASTNLGYGNFTTPIALGTAYTLYIGYDQATNHFTFRIGAEEITFGPTGLPARTRVQTHPGKA